MAVAPMKRDRGWRVQCRTRLTGVTSIERRIRLRFQLRIGKHQRKRPAELLRRVRDRPDRADAAASDRRNIS